MDFLALADIARQYSFTATGLIVLLSCLFALILIASYMVIRLCNQTRQQLRSGFLDPAPRRTLLNVSYLGYRLYLGVIIAPALIFYAILAAHP